MQHCQARLVAHGALGSSFCKQSHPSMLVVLVHSRQPIAQQTSSLEVSPCLLAQEKETVISKTINALRNTLSSLTGAAPDTDKEAKQVCGLNPNP